MEAPEGILAGLTQLCVLCPQPHGVQHPALPSTPVLWPQAGTRLAAAGSSSPLSCHKDVEPG